MARLKTAGELAAKNLITHRRNDFSDLPVVGHQRWAQKRKYTNPRLS